MDSIDMAHAKIIRNGGRVYLILEHEKGRTVLILLAGVWHFQDQSSRGSIADLLRGLG